MDLLDINKNTSTYCFPTASVCDYKRKLAVTKRYGKPGACYTAQTAFCLQISDARTMNRKTMCALTMQDCEKARKEVMNDPQKFSDVSVCKSTPNIDRFDRPTEYFDSDDSL